MSIKKDGRRRSCRSRFEENRHCFRVDETTYVYRAFSDEKHYSEQRIKVGEDGVTQEILDFLQQVDNAEAQDYEDDRKNADNRFLGLSADTEEEERDPSGGFAFVSASGTGGGSFFQVNRGYVGSPELLGPEAVLFPEEEEIGEMVSLFRKVVWPKLSEKEKNLFYSYYGAQLFAREIAEKTFKKNGKPLTEGGITKQIRLLRAKVAELMAPYLE